LEAVLRARAGAAVLITHDAADAFALADRIAVMQEGRLVQVGTPTELVAAPATPFVAEFTGAELLLDGVVEEAREGLVTVRLARGDARVVAALEPGAQALAAGAPAHVAYRPEDVVLAPAEGAGASSARNDFPLVVAGLTPAGGLVRVRLAGAPPLTALVTRESAAALALAPGKPVAARLKATALRAYPAAPLRPEPPPG
ncbi:MAG TPA: TOBE domain-containing protein, partial [Longimicrobiales bacterium]|nr:TOBE domain-containing protein [Longimicrobiales bacterium]